MDPQSLGVLAEAIADVPVAAVIDHVVRDPDGRPVGVVIDFVNAASTRLFLGQEPSRSVSLVGVDLLDVLPGEGGRTALDMTVRTATEGRTATGEWDGVVPAGRRHVRFVQAPLSGDYVLTWFEDISAYRTAESQRRSMLSRESDLRLALEASLDGLVIVRTEQGPDGVAAYRVDLATRRALEMVPALGSDAVLDRRTPGFGDLADVLDRAREAAARRIGRRGGDGGDRVLEITVDPMSDDRLLLALRDVTMHLQVERRATEAVETSSRRLQMLVRSFDAMPEAVAVFRRPSPGEPADAFVLQLVNGAGARREHGKAADVGFTVQRCWPFAEASGLLEAMTDASREERSQRLELPPVMFRDDEKIFEAVVAPLDDESLLVQLIDVTARRRAARDLLEAQERELESERSRGMLVEAIAHELRTPLTTVIAVTDLLASHDLSREQVELLDRQRVAARVMLNLIDDTLDLRRLESGADDDDVDVDVRAMLGEVALLLGPVAEEKGVEVQVRVEGSVPSRVRMRSSLAQQVMVNLGANALKFTDAGLVELSAETRVVHGPPDVLHLVLEVSDTGAGIAPEHLDELFERFRQGGRSVRRSHGGTGLGLAIVRGIVEALHGEIQVRSTLNEGTVFTVELPVRPAAEVPAPPEEPDRRISQETTAPTAPIRVLLAEDEDVNRVFVAALLTKLGAHVDSAADGVSALDRFLDADYDLVLLDVHMPVRDGIETVTAMRQAEADTGRPATRVLALTASPTPDVRADCLAAGMDGVLGKPIAFDELAAALDAARATLDL